jgi:EAL domain-containing protein (putative c-di-GMP-specific phosphodiesterase class I)
MSTAPIDVPSIQQKLRAPGRVLIAEDDETLLRAYGRVLRAAGFSVDEVEDANAALERLRNDRFDVVVSDIDMPSMDGIELLRAIRTTDLDLPFVVITGKPSVDTATSAIDLGVLRYLRKPVDVPTLIETITRAVRLAELSRLTQEAAPRSPFSVDAGGGVEEVFERALASVHMVFQPIVRYSQRGVMAVEALLRTREPSMASPSRFFAVAERIGKIHELGRAARAAVAAAANEIPAETRIFMNLHPIELLDASLYSPREPLSRVAGRVTLEITERAALHGMTNLRARIVALRALGYRIAIDDMGAGYASLTSFAQLEPDIAKVDMSLVRGIHLEPTKQSLVGGLCRMCDDLGIPVILEGVETRDELDALVALGCDLFQGFFFSRPTSLPTSVSWGD